MSPLSRREFVAALGAGALTVGARPAEAVEPIAGKAPRLWIDPRLETLPRRPWRKVHQDFHNTEHVGRIGARFDPDEYGDRLLAANVDAIVTFAKDMHGYFYYPSAHGPVHPGLSFDLLGKQVEACRKRGIAVYAYYCVSWDHHLARTRPEWLVVERDGSTHLPKPGETPGWTALCLAHQPFLGLVEAHARELVSRYEIDGAWFDMAKPIGPECFCAECRRQLAALGKDPQDAAAQRAHKHGLFVDLHRRLTTLVKQTRPSCQVDYNDNGAGRLGDRAAFLDNVDVEALPTAFWGYYYFPAQVRYTRTFGLTCYGMTGRFKAAWADFGGLKLPSQLQTECAAIVAQGARCDVGDQLPPDGRLEPAVYHVIGQAFAQVKALEPWLEGAAPVVEAALVTNDTPLGTPSDPTIYGWLKALVELRVQFDIVEPGAEWERYGLVVVPDEARVDQAAVERLHRFVAGGGSVVACQKGGLVAPGSTSWLERYGLRYAGESPFAPAYLVPRERLAGAIPEYAYALYEGAGQWRAEAPAVSMAQLGVPLFQRSAERYTSHAQTPFDHATDFTVLARSGTVGLVGFPLGRSYYQQGYWVYREALRRLLRAVAPRPLVETSAPMSAEVSVTRQRAAAGRPERYLVHVVNYSPLRRTPPHPEFYEDPSPLVDVTVRLNLPLRVASTRALLGGQELRPRARNGGIEVTLPRVRASEVACLELA